MSMTGPMTGSMVGGMTASPNTRGKGGGGRTGLEILQSKGASFFLHDFVSRTDLTFQEANGVTAADDVSESVALALSVDQIGLQTVAEFLAGKAELWTNPAPTVVNFGGTSGAYNTGTRVFTNSGSAVTGYPRFQFNLGLTSGKTYRVVGTLTGSISKVAGIRLAGSGLVNNFSYNTSTGAFTAHVSAAVAYIEFQLDAAASWTGADSVTISSISVKEISGQHSRQTGANSLRPTRQSDGGLKGDRSDDNLLQDLTSSTSMFMAAALLGASTPSAVAVIIGGPIGTARGYLARDAAGKLCAGVGANGPTTIVGGSDIATLKGVAMLNIDASGNVDLEWVPKGGSLQSLYSAPISGAVGAGTALRLFASNASGSPANYGGDTLYLAGAIQTTLTAAERRALAVDWNKRIPA